MIYFGSRFQKLQSMVHWHHGKASWYKDEVEQIARLMATRKLRQEERAREEVAREEVRALVTQ